MVVRRLSLQKKSVLDHILKIRGCMHRHTIYENTKRQHSCIRSRRGTLSCIRAKIQKIDATKKNPNLKYFRPTRL
jgi:hypothetical protein